MEDPICQTCGEPKKLTKEFWYQNAHNKNGFSVHCKACDKKYYDSHRGLPDAESIRRGKKKFLEEEPPMSEFDEMCLHDKVARGTQIGVISIYKEI